MVLQFDPYGNFVHYLGDYQGEPEFTSPGGIAIDRKRGRLFVVDSPRSLLFMLDLNGKVLKTIGRLRTGAGVTVFDYPSEVAVSGDRVFVLDASGSRIQILDTECNLMGSFSIPHGSDPLIGRENGLSADQQGNLYVSSIYGSVIRAFSPDGRLLATFGQSGLRVGEFEGPTGLWIDSANRLYVADSGNGRVQMFQLSTQQ
jgi:DNA-binding beta-propeller fold protein YncE